MGKYQTAVIISGLVTFIAAYHYIRIFNSWVAAYAYGEKNVGGHGDPVLTGVPFNDAYRYMDWLLTVPLLLIEIILVMKLSPEEASSRSWTLGVGSAAMIACGYPGELIVSGDLSQRWMCRFFSMCLLHVHCLHSLGWLVRCHQCRVRSKDCFADQERTACHSGQLVHIPCRVPFPNAGRRRSKGSGFHPGWLLCVRHHLQVRFGADDLPNHQGKV